MKNWLRTLPAALVLTGGILCFAVPPAAAQDDCFPIKICVYYGGLKICFETCI